MTDKRNQLLALLPAGDRQRLLAACVSVELRHGDVVCEPGEPLQQVLFPACGFIVLLLAVPGHPSVEVGMVGREGMLGAPLVLGVPSLAARGLVQGRGMAWGLGAEEFGRQLASCAALRAVLQRFVAVELAQAEGANACLRFHRIVERLARWLLMSHDRAQCDEFAVTHDFLAGTLGVRRVGITAAAGALQRRGLIRYHRGRMTVCDRAGLEQAACSCYASDRASYRELLH